MASKNAPAVPRRRYADFCNKIGEKPTRHSKARRVSQDVPLSWGHPLAETVLSGSLAVGRAVGFPDKPAEMLMK
jgi:hypothetical protein